ncbi:MAG: fatty acid hydroxylase, partial [Solirubrobacterales bacterium]
MAHERTSELSASPPMFESRFLDFFSRVHPAVPAIVFIPVVAAGIWLGIDRGLAVGTTILLFGVGVAIWTLTEYWLHRLVFHWQPKFAGGDRLHFIIHGVHHDHPNDAMRLVMPP